MQSSGVLIEKKQNPNEAKNSTSLIPRRLLALVGPPNSGKTSVFNWITGSQARTVNYPGSTVECFLGRSAPHWTQLTVGEGLKSWDWVDTPGVYSLSPKSTDEEVTLATLLKGFYNRPIEAVVLVLDASLLKRQLFLVEQLKEMRLPFVVALTMNDVLQASGFELQLDQLSEQLQVDFFLIHGRFGKGVPELLAGVDKLLQKLDGKLGERQALPSWSAQQWNESRQRVDQILKRAVKFEDLQKTKVSPFERSRAWDRILLSPSWGLIIFLLIMSTLFSSIFFVATPLMDLVDVLFSTGAEVLAGQFPNSLWIDFFANGVLLSLGAVAVFLPQIFILFFGVGILEDSGYLARAATLVDRPLSKLGLGGRSFVPLLSGFACAVPAMMAARTIRSSKEKWLTLFILPLMTCSARLPVYALCLSFIFWGQAAWKPGLALTAIYLLSLVIAGLISAVIQKFIPEKSQGFFLMDLPIYRKPQWRGLLHSSWLRTKSYLSRAGPVIFVLSVVIWLASAFPRQANESGVLLPPPFESSYLAQVGQSIEPVFQPLGLDWRAGMGLLSSFAAREVFVSTLAVLMNISEEEINTADEGTLRGDLIAKMQSAKMADGQAVFTTASVVGLIVFFMISLQCMSTVATALKETGSWKFAVLQWTAFTVFAYVLAAVVVQTINLI